MNDKPDPILVGRVLRDAIQDLDAPPPDPWERLARVARDWERVEAERKTRTPPPCPVQ